MAHEEFQTPQQRFGMRFVSVARLWRRHLDVELRELGLSDASWPPLIYLAEAGEALTQKELARRIGIDGSTLVRLVDQHVQAGWIERCVDVQDRRAWWLQLTRSGRGVVRRIQAALDRAETQMLAGLGASDLAVTLATFESIASNIHALQGRP